MSPEPSGEQDFRYGPYLVTALICERVLEEKDGVKSAIRIVDHLNRTSIGPEPSSVMEPFDQDLSLFIRLKAGGARGMYRVEVRVVKPSMNPEETPALVVHPVHFTGPDEGGADLVLRMRARFDEEGLWWFDVYMNAIRVVRVPLRIMYHPQIMGPGVLPLGS